MEQAEKMSSVEFAYLTSASLIGATLLAYMLMCCCGACTRLQRVGIGVTPLGGTISVRTQIPHEQPSSAHEPLHSALSNLCANHDTRIATSLSLLFALLCASIEATCALLLTTYYIMSATQPAANADVLQSTVATSTLVTEHSAAANDCMCL
jgi:hypothetical protein